MTVSSADLTRAINKLKASGVRITPQRHAVLEYLLTTMTHPTADEIYKALGETFPNMSMATVYNNLKVLKETGLVQEMTFGDNSSRFDCNTQPHYHIKCNQCGKIVDFDYPALDEVESLAARVTGFDVSHHRMELYGTCEACQKLSE